MDETTGANDVSSIDQIKEGASKDTDLIASDQIVKTEEEELDTENEQVKIKTENKRSSKGLLLSPGEITEEINVQNSESAKIKRVEGSCDNEIDNATDNYSKTNQTTTLTLESSKGNIFSETGESSKSIQSKQLDEGLSKANSKGVIQTKNIQPKSILKTTSSEPTIIVTPPPKPPQHSASSDDFRNKRGKKKYINYLNDSRTVQEFVNPAFELDENVPNDFRLADIVQQVLQQEVSKYQHPFGKGNLYNTVFLGEKSVAYTGGGRFILWFIFAFALVGMAGVIIFMSEIYKSDERGGGNLTSS